MNADEHGLNHHYLCHRHPFGERMVNKICVYSCLSVVKKMEKGIEKREKEIALNSIEAGLDNETISKITSLTTRQIEELRKSH